MRQILRALTFPGRSIGSLGFDRIGLVLLALAMLSLTSSSAASAALVCSNTVRNCGCAITSSGVYTLAAALASSGAGDCLSIAAKNVVLNLNGFAITGPGSGSNGSGIHVKNASSVWIEGQGAAALPPTISGWKYGIENDGNDVLIENIKVAGNASAGVFFFKAGNSELVNFESSSNSGFGVWLRSGSNDQVGNGLIQDNVLDGILVGCVANGKGMCSGGGGKATANSIYSVTSNDNGGGGITVQFNADFNQIGKCTASGNTGNDLVDRHPGANNCGHDLWFANTPGTVNKSCVQ